MQKPEFGETLDLIVKEDPRFHREAYFFLRDSLDYTLKLRKKAKEGSEHVTGPQLLEGIRQHALKQFGPMVPTVFAYWGVKRCEDFGEMVFNFIRVGIFGKAATDSINDFKGGFSFDDAFVLPFLPEKPMSCRRISADRQAQEAR